MNSQQLPELPEDFFLVMISGTSSTSVKGSVQLKSKVARFEANLFYVPLNQLKLVQHYVHFQVPYTTSSRNYHLGSIYITLIANIPTNLDPYMWIFLCFSN